LGKHLCQFGFGDIELLDPLWRVNFQRQYQGGAQKDSFWRCFGNEAVLRPNASGFSHFCGKGDQTAS